VNLNYSLLLESAPPPPPASGFVLLFSTRAKIAQDLLQLLFLCVNVYMALLIMSADSMQLNRAHAKLQTAIFWCLRSNGMGFILSSKVKKKWIISQCFFFMVKGSL
jgi:hypothetical protein